MTDYRAPLEDYGQEEIMETYSQYIGNYGGLFGSETRQNLLAINPKNPNPFVDTPKQWSNIKKSVRNGFVDFQLVCKIANSNQLKKMFEHLPYYPQQGPTGSTPIEFLDIVSHNLVPALSAIFYSDMADDAKQNRWKSELAIRIIGACLDYFLNSHLIRSPVHQRHLSEVGVILRSEIYR